MMSEVVTVVVHTADELGVRGDPVSLQEECPADAVPLHDVQNRFRPRRIRSIIKGQTDRTRCRGAGREQPACRSGGDECATRRLPPGARRQLCGAFQSHDATAGRAVASAKTDSSC